MPRIFDNIEQDLLPALAETLAVAERADFCVGYFNLRGWRAIDEHVERWAGGAGRCCRLLVGMQRLPHEGVRLAHSLAGGGGALDHQTALRLKKRLAEEFREQLTLGAPSNADEAACAGCRHRSGRGRSSSSSSSDTRCTPSSTSCSGPTRSTRPSAIWAAAT